MKVILAIDSFKGSLSSAELADISSCGVKDVFPDAVCVKIPVADGGEGTLEAARKVCKMALRRVCVKDPLGREIFAKYGLFPDGSALVETAQASGLTLVVDDARNIMNSNTFGTGQLMLHALENGAKKILVGIGGSATNDAGVGMLAALGFKFFDADGKPIPYPLARDLGRISRIDTSDALGKIRNCSFEVACDVKNPFCGPNGAARVFARQKGANNTQIELLDSHMRSISKVFRKTTGVDIENMCGAGAAGGLGGALMAFLGAKFKSGADFILDIASFDRLLEDTDFVVTGEGRIDAQTAFGKAPYTIARRAASKGVKVVAICGSLSEDARTLAKEGICAMFPVSNAATTLKEAMSKPVASENVRRTVREIFNLVKAFV